MVKHDINTDQASHVIVQKRQIQKRQKKDGGGLIDRGGDGTWNPFSPLQPAQSFLGLRMEERGHPLVRVNYLLIFSYT